MVRRLAIKMKLIAIKAFFFFRENLAIKIADTISGSKVVSIADSHPGDRGLTPRQRENF